MAYNPKPPAHPAFIIQDQQNLLDWLNAPPGKWFIGVVDTQHGRIFVVPVNVFEGRGALDPQTLNNASQRGMNRYASGVPADRRNAPQGFRTFGQHNWLEARAAGVTHHTGVAMHYGSSPADCLGFTLIKVGGTVGNTFAQLKCSSNSLNAGKPDTTVLHNFSQATATRPPPPPGQPSPGSFQMPLAWTNAIVTYFNGPPFNISHIAVSND